MRQIITRDNIIKYTTDTEFEDKLTYTTMLVENEMCVAYVWNNTCAEFVCVFEYWIVGRRYDYGIIGRDGSYSDEFLEKVATTLCEKILDDEVIDG